MRDQQPAATERRRAQGLLLLLTLVWGSTFVVVPSAVALVSPLLLVALRFGLAWLVLVAFRPVVAREGLQVVLPAIPLSLAMFGGFLLQTYGLMRTTPGRSAFITSLSVVMVPVLDMFDTHRLPRLRLAGAALVAAAGVFVLFHPIEGEWGRGDTLTLISAAIFAFYIVELDRRSARHPVLALVAAQCLTIAPLAAALGLLVEPPRLVPGWTTALMVAYLGVVCTAITFVLMTWAQVRVGAVQSAVIYTLEPIVATLLSVALGREPWGARLPAGGLLVVLAMLIASTDPTRPHPVAPPSGID